MSIIGSSKEPGLASIVATARMARGCAVLLACVGVALTLDVAALFATSAPSFARARSYATGKYPYSVAIGDLNGDGKPDLAIGANTVSVLLNRGDCSFQSKREYATGGANSVAIGDLNGDGKPDLATAAGDTGVSVLLNSGDCSFQSKRDYATGRDPIGRDRRPERRPQARPGDREPLATPTNMSETRSPRSSTRRASARCRTSRDRHCGPRSGRSRAPIAASGRSAAPSRRGSRRAA